MGLLFTAPMSSRKSRSEERCVELAFRALPMPELWGSGRHHGMCCWRAWSESQIHYFITKETLSGHLRGALTSCLQKGEDKAQHPGLLESRNRLTNVKILLSSTSQGIKHLANQSLPVHRGPQITVTTDRVTQIGRFSLRSLKCTQRTKMFLCQKSLLIPQKCLGSSPTLSFHRNRSQAFIWKLERSG